MPIESDVTILDRNETAVVTKGEGLEILVARCDILPDSATFIIACAMRYYDDPEFREDVMEWMKDCIKQAS